MRALHAATYLPQENSDYNQNILTLNWVRSRFYLKLSSQVDFALQIFAVEGGKEKKKEDQIRSTQKNHEYQPNFTIIIFILNTKYIYLYINNNIILYNNYIIYIKK